MAGADPHWLIFKIGNTGTAVYSENHIAWDAQEFGKQRAANERTTKSFVKRVPGLNNLWIIHAETLTSNYTFDAFVAKGGRVLYYMQSQEQKLLKLVPGIVMVKLHLA